MITIDGAQGEGGGQVLRTSLTLALCLGKAVRIENIRAGRKNPGLLRQHLTCVKAAQSICNGEVSGAEIGSGAVSLVPGKVTPGDYCFAVGSAGSTTLVFQTLWLPLALAGGISSLYLQGGTHNGMAPSFDFIQRCFLPIIGRIGCQIDAELESFGFYPAGGGAWVAKIKSVSSLKSLQLSSPGAEKRCLAVATSARIPSHVTQRELAMVGRKCQWPREQQQQRLVASAGPGNIMSLQLESEELTELFEVVGERGRSAEKVALAAIQAMQRYQKAEVAVGEYLADQLLLPMVMGAGGCFVTLKPSQHLLTNIAVIRQFSGADIELKELGRDRWLVTVPGLLDAQTLD